MSFKQVLDLDCDVATALGGTDKKSGKKNPTQVEGYLIGSKEIPDKFSKTGTGYLHIFQTQEGRVGVFGKTDLNRKIKNVAPGTMVRATFTGTIPTKFGDMAKYMVETDEANVIEVALNNNTANSESSDDSSYTSDPSDEDVDANEDETALDEVVPPRPTKPAKAAATADAARQARVQALLSAGKNRS